MKGSTKVGLTFVGLALVAGFGGPLVFGEGWDHIQRIALPIYLGVGFLVTFGLRFRERFREIRDERSKPQSSTGRRILLKVLLLVAIVALGFLVPWVWAYLTAK